MLPRRHLSLFAEKREISTTFMNRRYIEFHYMAGRLLKGCLPTQTPAGDADDRVATCDEDSSHDDAGVRAAFIRALAEECELPDKS